MSFFESAPDEISLLVCYDVDGASASRIADLFVKTSVSYDGIILCGPMTHSVLKSQEDQVVASGDMASIIAQLENIVCRVVYLPSATDPIDTCLEQMHLTPNSVNIAARRVDLAKGLFITGFSEHILDMNSEPSVPAKGGSADTDGDLEDVSLKASSCMSVIKTLVQTRASAKISNSSTANGNSRSSSDSRNGEVLNNKEETGIFAFNYKYSHSLNELLFYQLDELYASGVQLCIIVSCDVSNSETMIPPTKLGNMPLLSPKSLRNGGHYSTVKLKFDSATSRWVPTEIRSDILPSI